MNFKNVFSLSVIAMTLVVLSSCREDDGPSPVIDETNLVGTWLFKSGAVAGDATETDILNNDLEGLRLAFKRDGTYFATFPDGLDRDTWIFENNTITFGKGTEYEEIFEVLELSPTTLVLHAPGEVDSDGDFVPAATLTFSNISKDDPVPLIDKTNLVGTWLFESVVVTGDATATASLQLVWTFKSDGTFIFTYPDGDEDRGTWTFENNTLTFDTGTEDEAIFEVLELSPTTLVLHIPEEVDSDGYTFPAVTLTFQRVQ